MSPIETGSIGWYHEPQMRQRKEMRLKKPTEVLDKLRERDKYRNSNERKFGVFWDRIINRCMQEPFEKNNYVLIGGGTGVGKTVFSSQLMLRLKTAPELKEREKTAGKKLKLCYLSFGRIIELYKELQQREGRTTSDIGYTSKDELNEYTQYGIDLIDFSSGVIKKPTLVIVDGIFVSKYGNTGSNRLFELARHLVVNFNAITSIITASEEQIDETFEERDDVRKSDENEIKDKLLEHGTIDDRNNQANIKKSYFYKGNDMTRENIDDEISRIMSKAIKTGRLGSPLTEDAYNFFKNNREARNMYFSEIFLPEWLRMLYGKENPEDGFILKNEKITKPVHSYEQFLSDHDLAKAVSLEVHNKRISYQIKIARALGIVDLANL